MLTKEVSNFLLRVGGSLYLPVPWNTYISWLLQEAVGIKGSGFPLLLSSLRSCDSRTYGCSVQQHPQIPTGFAQKQQLQKALTKLSLGVLVMVVIFIFPLILSSVEKMMSHTALHYRTMKSRQHATVHKRAKGYQGLPFPLLMVRAP